MMGALITALMALVLPVDVAIGMLLPLLIIGDFFAVIVHWRKWRVGLIRVLIPGALGKGTGRHVVYHHRLLRCASQNVGSSYPVFH
jgi:uncharacterized membrane protein YfcA